MLLWTLIGNEGLIDFLTFQKSLKFLNFPGLKVNEAGELEQSTHLYSPFRMNLMQKYIIKIYINFIKHQYNIFLHKSMYNYLYFHDSLYDIYPYILFTSIKYTIIINKTYIFLNNPSKCNSYVLL